MRFTLLAEIALFGIAARAWHPEGHEWQPPRPGDSRSPCPGLNAMANHGYLPRSGKNIDLEALRKGVSGAYNFEPTTFDDVFNLTVAFNLTTTGNISTINLEDLKAHDKIEFDGSLSRNDFYFGDDWHFDYFIWSTVANRLGLYEVPQSKMDHYVTVETAAKARAARVEDAKKANPSFNASANEMMGSPGTTGLYLTTLWDNAVGAAPKAWIRAFFENDRIPYLEGYRAPKEVKTREFLNEMVKRVMEADVSSVTN